MKVTHEGTLIATCPVDGKPDRYRVAITCARVVKVEDIIAVVDQLKDQTIFQEDATQELARRLGAQVTTIGYHSGWKSTCEC